MLRGAKGYGWFTQFVDQGPQSFKKNVPPTAFNWETTESPSRPRVFFDVSMGQEKLGKIIFELASDITPRYVENFKALCLRDAQGYKKTKFFQVQKGHVIAGGDVESNNGEWSHSASDERFLRDENFIIPHASAGLLRYVFLLWIFL